MSESKASLRRMAENQVVFRRFNEKLQKDIDKVNRVAAETGDDPIVVDGNEPLFFYCECSDEQCALRIKVSLNEYARIHSERDCFTIIPGHDVTEIEEVIETLPEYAIVRKYVTPRESARELATTDINNA